MSAPTVDPNAGRALWVTQEMRDARRRRAEVYDLHPGGLEELWAKGKVILRPQIEQILLLAIVPQYDCHEAMTTDDYNARLACAHEILAIGPGCPHYWREREIPEDVWPTVGQHCFVVSAAANRLSKTDLSIRLWGTHVEDVTQVWDPPG